MVSAQTYAQSANTTKTDLNTFANIVRNDGETLGVMVTGVEYATGWNPLRAYFYPRSEQKLLIVHFVVKNRNSRNTRFSAASTNFTAIGSDNAQFRQEANYNSRIAGTTDPFDDTLKPGQSQALYSAVVVNGDADIEAVQVDPQTTGPKSTSIMVNVSGKVAQLPESITDKGAYKNDFDGVFNQTYRQSTADVSLRKFITIGKLAAAPTSKVDVWGIAQVSFRNMHAEKRRVFYDTFKPTRALTNTGRLVKPQYLVTPSMDEMVDQSLEYNDVVQAAIAFPLESGETISEVFLRERPARARDDKETSISIHYTLDSDKNPLDKLINRNLPQLFSGVNRRPAFESEAVPPGVYDPVRSWADFFADNGSVPPDALANTGPKDVNGAVLVPFFSPPPLILGRPEDQTPAANPTQPADTPTPPNLNLALRVKNLKINQAQEVGGDDPWLAVMAFRGIPGRPDTAEALFIPSTMCKTVGSNMANGGLVNLSTELGLREFKDVKPFEIIGLYVIAAEVDGGSASDRDASALRMANKLFKEWKATLSRANPAPLNDYSLNNVRRQAQNLNVVYQTFLSTCSFNNEFSAPGTVDDDEYAGRSGAIWMYLPGLADTQAMAISKVPLIGRNGTLITNGYVPKGDWNLPLWHSTGSLSVIDWTCQLSLYSISP